MTENETMKPGEAPDDTEGLSGDLTQHPDDSGAPKPPNFNFEGDSSNGADPSIDGLPADSLVEGEHEALAEAGELADATGEGVAAGSTEAATSRPIGEGASGLGTDSFETTQTPSSSFSTEANGEMGTVVSLEDAIKQEAKDTMSGTGFKIGIAVAVVAALLIGLLIGAFVINGGKQQSTNTVAGKSKVTEAELESEIASLTIVGKTEAITVKEVLEQNGSPEAVKDASGEYAVPSADAVLTTARNKVLVADAAAKGIQLSDEDIAAYAQKQLGSSDFESIGANYGMDAQSVVNLLRESALLEKLRENVMGDTSSTQATLPDLPAEPKASSSSSSAASDNGEGEGEETSSDSSAGASSSSVSKEYADYIITLAGDEWDKAKGTWASTSGPYYQALSSFEITPEGASYEAAMAAYYVAYQAYSQEASTTANVWTDYVNGLLSKASITIYTLSA